MGFFKVNGPVIDWGIIALQVTYFYNDIVMIVLNFKRFSLIPPPTEEAHQDSRRKTLWLQYSLSFCDSKRTQTP